MQTNINQILEQIYINNKKAIEEWFEAQYKNSSRCFYSSVDIRNSGDKLVPVDTNLFPAGFNNFTDEEIDLGSKYVRNFFICKNLNIKNILILAEAHSRNKFYLDNLLNIKKLFNKANYNIEFAMLNLEEEIPNFPLTEITFKNNEILTSTGFKPEVIILNTDLSGEINNDLKNCNIPIIPSVTKGWYLRTKTKHIESYNNLANLFCKEFNLDPFYITSIIMECANIDFKKMQGLECVAHNVDDLIRELKIQYKEHNIKQQPYVFVKANKGTYGMGIMCLRSGEEIFEMNKKNRHSMAKLKSGTINNNVIIQEGIKTIDQIDNNPAEPLIYLIDCQPIGITYRSHKLKDDHVSLNSPGMTFIKKKEIKNQIALELLARLSSLSSCFEL